MSYTPNTWHPMDVITSKKLNDLEQGLTQTSDNVVYGMGGATQSSDGIHSLTYINKGDALPNNPQVGDTIFMKDGDDFSILEWDGEQWSTRVDPKLSDRIQTALDEAKDNAETLVNNNNTSINTMVDQVTKDKIALALKDADFNNKAQAMANKALQDAKANTATVAQETLNSANANIADAKKSLSDDIAKEVSDRASAVSTLDTKAQGYADQAKQDAINAATTADGVINKKIDDTTSSISSTISQNKQDAEGKISTAQSTATQALNGLSTKVSQTDYNTKTGQLQTDLTTTTQTANKATTDIVSIQQKDNTQDARMTQIESDASGVKTTVSDLQTTQGKQSGDISTLKQRADGFEATVTKVDNLSVGGRNYYILSTGSLGWLSNGNIVNSAQDKTSDFIKVISTSLIISIFSSGINTYGNDVLALYDSNKVFISQTVVLGNYPTDNHHLPDPNFKIINLPNNVAYVRYQGATNATYKVEFGTLPTDWTPAPEDVDSATAKAQLTADQATTTINTYKTSNDGRVASAESKITQNANAITQKVSQTDYDKKTGDLATKVNTAQSTADSATSTIGSYKTSNDARVASAESKITANANAITQKVSQTDYNQKTGELSGSISTLKQRADGFDTTVTKVNNLSVGGTNLVSGTNQEYQMGYGIPKTTWQDGYAYLKLPTNVISGEILPQSPHTFSYTLVQGTTYTQTVWFETDATIKDLSTAQITWFTNSGHDVQQAIIQKLGKNSYKIVSTYTWPGKTDNNVRLFDIEHLDSAFDLSTGTYLKFGKLKLETGNMPTDWTPAPEDTDNKISTVSQTVDGISSIVSDPTTGLTKRVQTAEGTLSQVTGTDIPALQNATFWQPYSSLNFNDYTKQGSFFFSTTAVKTNGPVSWNNSWLYLIVEQGTSAKDRIKQTAWYDGVTGVKITYVRTLNSGTWSPWYANDNDSVTTISQTNESIKTEISNRQTGDTNTLTQAKDFTSSQISNSETNMKSLINQKADSVIVGTMSDSVDQLKSVANWQQISYNDLNYLQQTGNYLITQSDNTNFPPGVTAWVYLKVEAPRSNRVTQRLWKDLNATQSYVRTYNGTSWSAWSQQVTSSTLLSIFKDSWSLGTSINNDIGSQITSGIVANSGNMALISKKVIIDSPSTQITGTAWVNSAMIANAAIQTVNIADAAITSAKIAQLDVAKLTGNVSSFIQSNWNGIYGSTSIDANGLSVNTGATVTTFDVNGVHLVKNGQTAHYEFGNWSDTNGNTTSASGLYLGATGTYNSFINILGSSGASGVVIAGYDMDYGSNTNIVKGAVNLFYDTNVRSRLLFKGNNIVKSTYIEADEIRRTMNFYTDNAKDGNGNWFWFNHKVLSTGTFSSTSLLSKKNVIADYEEDALGEISKTDIVEFEYKNDVGEKHISPIIDDVNDEKDYYIPKTILGQDGEYVDMYSMISMAWKAIKQLNEKIGDK